MAMEHATKIQPSNVNSKPQICIPRTFIFSETVLRSSCLLYMVGLFADVFCRSGQFVIHLSDLSDCSVSSTWDNNLLSSFCADVSVLPRMFPQLLKYYLDFQLQFHTHKHLNDDTHHKCLVLVFRQKRCRLDHLFMSVCYGRSQKDLYYF